MQILFETLEGFGPKFLQNENGAAALRFAILFGAIGLAMALLVPKINNVSERYAMENATAVDHVVTGSISQENSKRYTVRRSVLDPR